MPVPAIYSEEWREKYSPARYLEHISLDALAERYTDLLVNILDFWPDGRSQIRGLDGNTKWTRAIADVVSELTLRGLRIGWLGGIEHSVLERPYPRVARAVQAWGSRNPALNSCAVKYGRREHMTDFIERGRIRIAPASSYADPSLTPALRDAELEFAMHLPPGTRIQMELEHGSGVFHDIPGIIGLITTRRECDDFYVLSTSAVFDPRLFDDFDPAYDACVVIHDLPSFIDRVRSQAVPAGKISGGSVVYLDPYRPHATADVPFVKHFRYAYQNEWRLIWMEPLNAPPLRPFFLELGDLRSYCELISL